jgi:hypothetical protein
MTAGEYSELFILDQLLYDPDTIMATMLYPDTIILYAASFPDFILIAKCYSNAEKESIAEANFVTIFLINPVPSPKTCS